VNGFLFDSNLPSHIRFAPGLPIVHASVLGKAATDTELWEYARQSDFVKVTKDADFSERIITATPPPRVVHLRF
jgi:predicted nuclease of predicted toxin-antitoxin system